MSKHPSVSIQVLPLSLGAHAGLNGPFVHLEFPAQDDPDVIFVENPLGDMLSRDNPDLTATFRERFWKLEDVATRRDGFEKFIRS